MSMHFRALADQASADGEISAAEVLGLRREAWPDGAIDLAEADAIFELNDHLKHSSPDWVDFFVESITEFLIASASPRGYLDADQAAWLIGHIERDRHVDSMAELELLEKLFEKAENVPESLKTFALDQIEAAVLTGDGPTRDGEELTPGTINAEECRLLRRFVFAPGGGGDGGGGAWVSKAQAEMLFRIKDATLGADNCPEWQKLFVQGVGNFLQGFGGHEPLSAGRAEELEAFMNDTAVNIGGFFARMAHAKPIDSASMLFLSEDMADDIEAEAAAAHAVTGDEQLWLNSHIDADGRLDELEKALLAFLAEEV